MNTALTAIDDGWTAGNYNWADLFFVVATVVALLAAVAYASTARNTSTTPTVGRLHVWAPTLLAVAVAAIAFALFLL